MERESQLGIIILAAGKASRMGNPKALLTYKGHSFLQNTFYLAQSVNPQAIITVLGHYSDQMSAHCRQYNIPYVMNIAYEEGMSTSIRCGLNQLLYYHPSLMSVLILLADQPKIVSGHLMKMIFNLSHDPVKMVCTSYGGTSGVPAIFKQDLFHDLLQLKGEKGAKDLIRKNMNCEQNIVACEEGYIDIDTPEDYNQLILAEKLYK